MDWGMALVLKKRKCLGGMDHIILFIPELMCVCEIIFFGTRSGFGRHLQ